MRILSALLLGALALGCDDDTDPDTPEAVSITGAWVDNFGTEHDITADTWVQSSPMGDSTYAILSVDNAAMTLIAENDAGNSFAPGKFSRFDWTEADGTLYYCQTAFDADSADAAANTPDPDPSDPAMGGCSMFTWSALAPR